MWRHNKYYMFFLNELQVHDFSFAENERNPNLDNEGRKPQGKQLAYCHSALPW